MSSVAKRDIQSTFVGVLLLTHGDTADVAKCFQHRLVIVVMPITLSDVQHDGRLGVSQRRAVRRRLLIY